MDRGGRSASLFVAGAAAGAIAETEELPAEMLRCHADRKFAIALARSGDLQSYPSRHQQEPETANLLLFRQLLPVLRQMRDCLSRQQLIERWAQHFSIPTEQN